MKVLVFDLGGTLMEYVGMPNCWVSYYKQGFQNIARNIGYDISQEALEKSILIMKNFNPRVNYREQEYTPEYIFKKSLHHWNVSYSIQQVITSFFEGIQLVPKIYDDSLWGLMELKRLGIMLAALTDLPTAMPDEYFKKSISELLEYIDYYVSSQSCGYRKPNCSGLKRIAQHFHVPVNQLIFVGDEEKDRLTAENAQCHFIMIRRTGSKRAGAIKSVSDLLRNTEILE